MKGKTSKEKKNQEQIQNPAREENEKRFTLFSLPIHSRKYISTENQRIEKNCEAMSTNKLNSGK